MPPEGIHNMPVVNIMVADDHQVVRLGLKTILSQEPGFQVIGEAADGLETIRLVQKLKPEVLVLDLMMPVLSGMAVIEELSRQAGRPRIIVLSMHTNEAYVTEALRKGAHAYVVKDSIAAEIIEAVRAVMAGQQYLSGQLRSCPLNGGGASGLHATRGRNHALTLREQEILSEIAQGKANKEIADQLSISVRTVEAHRAKIMRKLGIHSHAGLIQFAMRENFLSLP